MTRRVLAAAAAIAALAVVAFAVAGALYEPNTEIPAGFAGSHVDVNGVALRVLQEGRGRDVLLIHGSPGSLEDWTPIFDRLSGSFRLTSYDRPGHGFSADAGEYSAAANATWALGLIDALGLDDVVVVGHS